MASFSDFVIARTGMMSSQMALNITGQNISNINTAGYTRRSLDQVTFVLNGSGLYRSSNTFSAGAGVMMTGISQLRDPYLDIRFRDEMSNVGSADALLGGMEQIDKVINDVGIEGITTQFQDLLDKFGKLNANNIGTDEFNNLIKNSAESLCQLLNQAASKLQDVKENYQMKYEEEVKNVNTLIDNIRNINEQIRKADINGDLALELRDQRNTMLDELSQYMKVDITYGSENLGSGIEIEKLTISIVDESTGKPAYTLIDGINSSDITINDDYSLNVSALKDKNGNDILNEDGSQFAPNGNIAGHTAVDNPKSMENERYIIGYGALESMRQILTGKGEFAITEERLQEIQAEYQTKYKEEVDAVNTLIDKISEINQKIQDADINGTPADDLRDQRDDMLYKLSQYMDIKISYGEELLDTGERVEKLTVKVIDENTGKSEYTLIDGTNSSDITINADKSLNVTPLKDKDGIIIEIPKIGADGTVETDPVTGEEIMVVAVPNGNIGKNPDPLDANQDYIEVNGSLQSIREVLVDGDKFIDADTNETCGIPYYEESLNALAKAFAEAMNKINTEDAEGNPLVDPYNPDNTNNIAGAGDLFETSDGSDEITASNISISDEWRNGIVEIVTSTVPNAPTTANDNISRFQDLFNKNFTFSAEINGLDTDTIIYKGNFEGYYANMQAVLGSDMQSVASLYDTYATSADELNNSRDAVSGVDLNEEGVNMIQYQKAFAASCRMMTALDELMDKVINGMGVVGR